MNENLQPRRWSIIELLAENINKSVFPRFFAQKISPIIQNAEIRDEFFCRAKKSQFWNCCQSNNMPSYLESRNMAPVILYKESFLVVSARFNEYNYQIRMTKLLNFLNDPKIRTRQFASTWKKHNRRFCTKYEKSAIVDIVEEYALLSKMLKIWFALLCTLCTKKLPSDL